MLQQLVDLGYNRQSLYNHTSSLEKFIQEMERSFHLVMISERFEESMVLLADLLCWPLEKVASFKVNVRKSELKASWTDKFRQQTNCSQAVKKMV